MPVKFYKRQLNSYYCGPAVMQLVLRARNIRITQKQLATEATTTEIGTSPSNLVATLAGYGLSVQAAQKQTLSDIARALRAGKHIIACITDEGEGHYILPVKVTRGTVEYIDTLHRARVRTVSRREFLAVWHDPLLTKTYRWAAYIS
jgi:ABC-type bacteriocin/lantibiotic exporter with double-glycine peptidase domain